MAPRSWPNAGAGLRTLRRTCPGTHKGTLGLGRAELRAQAATARGHPRARPIGRSRKCAGRAAASGCREATRCPRAPQAPGPIRGTSPDVPQAPEPPRPKRKRPVACGQRSLARGALRPRSTGGTHACAGARWPLRVLGAHAEGPRVSGDSPGADRGRPARSRPGRHAPRRCAGRPLAPPATALSRDARTKRSHGAGVRLRVTLGGDATGSGSRV